MTDNTVPAEDQKATRVEIDATTHEHVFDAWILTNDHWNGWVLPSFDLDTAKRVAQMVTSDGGEQNYYFHFEDSGRLTIVEFEQGSEGLVDLDDLWIEVNDGPRYAIGAGSWTWQEVPDEAPTEPAALDAWLTHRATVGAAYVENWNKALFAAKAAGANTQQAVAAAQRAVSRHPDDENSTEQRARALHAALVARDVTCNVHWDRSPWGVRIPLIDSTDEYAPSLFVMTEGTETVAGYIDTNTWFGQLGHFNRDGDDEDDAAAALLETGFRWIERYWLGDTETAVADNLVPLVALLRTGATAFTTDTTPEDPA